MNIFGVIDFVLIIIILAFALNQLRAWIQSKCVGGALTNEEFEKGKRKAQVTGVHEKDPFKREHILGVRNISHIMPKYQCQEIRPDLPVYLYSDPSALTVGIACFLQKRGYKKTYWLKDGFEKWDGQTKSSKY